MSSYLIEKQFKPITNNLMIKFAIIGCGHIAQRHAKHIQQHPHAQLVGAYDIVPEKNQAFVAQHQLPSFPTLDALLQHSNADIVNVCTPNGSHHETVIAALQAGKHVLVEKPMAIRKSDCEDMVLTALRYNRSLFVVKQNRFNPPVQAVKQLIHQQKLGQIYNVVVNCFWNRNAQYYQNSDWKGTKALDGGTLFTQFSHFVDVVYYLFGDFEVKYGVVKNVAHGNLIEFEDTGHFGLHFKKSGALGSFSYTTATYQQNMEGSITVFAEHATIKIGGKYLNTIDYQATNGFDISDLPNSNPANNYGYYEGSMSNHDKVMDNVVQTLQGKAQIMTNAYEGLKVVELIEQMYTVAR